MKGDNTKSEIQAPAKLQKIAVKAIHATFDAVYGEGGLEDAQKALDAKRESASAHIMALAQNSPSVEVFLAACKVAETALSSEHGNKPISEILPQWRQYKSNIRAAWNKGMAPKDYKSEGVLRKALNEARKEAKGTGKANTVKAAKPLVEGMNRLAGLLGQMEEDAAVAFLNDTITRAENALAAILPETPDAPAEGEHQQEAQA